MTLNPVKERHFPEARVFTCDEGFVEVLYVEASRVKFLNRSDAAIVQVPVLVCGGRRIALGAISESPTSVYRIIAFGQTPSPADDSLEYSRQAAIDSLYNYRVESDRAKESTKKR